MHQVHTINRKRDYLNFRKNLRTKDGSHDKNFNHFQEEWIPIPYACPVPEACQGGINSLCNIGYEGPLCAICAPGYYSLVSRCISCPSVGWLAGQIVITSIVFISLAVVVIRDRKQDGNKRSITDIVLARVKILITFYQITSIIMESFSYVRWPSEMVKFQQYMKFVQLNLLQVAPLHCFEYSLKMNSYSRVIFYICFNITVLLAFVLYYQLKKRYIKKYSLQKQNQQQQKLSNLKEQCWRNSIFILFIIYPSTCLEILQILPVNCHRICHYKGDMVCNEFLRSDYSVNCGSKDYQMGIPLFWLSAVYVALFPTALLILLFKYVRKNNDEISDQSKTPQATEIKEGLSFLYENYSPNCWFWELIELGRKVVFTLAIVIADTESRSYLAMLVVMSGLYAVLVAYHKPISDRFEYWLQVVSLVASLANLIIGMLLKVPFEESHSAVAQESESVVVTMLMIAANLIIVVIVAGRNTRRGGVRGFEHPFCWCLFGA